MLGFSRDEQISFPTPPPFPDPQPSPAGEKGIETFTERLPCAHSFIAPKQHNNPEIGINVNISQLRKIEVQRAQIIYSRTHTLETEGIRFSSQAPQCFFYCVDRSFSNVLLHVYILIMAVVLKSPVRWLETQASWGISQSWFVNFRKERIPCGRNNQLVLRKRWEKSWAWRETDI